MPDNAIEWAADLVPALQATGTGERQLAAIREAMVAKFNGPDATGYPPDHAARHLTSDEAIAALEQREAEEGRSGHSVTVAKARQLARSGKYVEPAAVGTARGVEALLPAPPRVKAPQPAVGDPDDDTTDEGGPPASDGAGDSDDDDLDDMTVPELRALAAADGIDLQGETKKADIVAVIRLARGK